MCLYRARLCIYYKKKCIEFTIFGWILILNKIFKVSKASTWKTKKIKWNFVIIVIIRIEH